MDETEAPNISIKGSVSGSNLINGDHNKIEINQYGASKPFNDKGVFMPAVRNMLFTGREDALAALATALSGDKNVVITQAITGMGGLGKSQLALEFAYRSADSFVSAHWLNLMDPSQFNSEIAACGRQMGLLDDSAKQPDMVAETLRVWALRGPRLLVLDNYESAADAMQTLAPLLALPTLRLLITARRAEFPPELGLHTYPLEVFTPTESVEFIRKLVKLKEDQTPEIEKLAETLGHLPLALHLAGHYLREEGISPAEYLIELDEVLSHESMQADWFAQMEIKSPTQHEQSLLGTFELSWRKVTDETAQTIFKVAGYLAPNEPIPLEIFAAVLGVDEKDRRLRKALRHLEKVGLFTSKGGLPVIHPLLAAYGRYLNNESNELLKKLTEKVISLSKHANQIGLPKKTVRVAVHLGAVATHAENARLEIASVLWNNYGYYLQQIANYKAARNVFERALQFSESVLGKNHPEIATFLNNLALVLKNIGDYQGACKTYECAIQILKGNFGAAHPQMIGTISNLAVVLQELGDYSAARNAFEYALQVEEATFGKNHPNVGIRINNLGAYLKDIGDLDGARAAFQRAIQIGEISLDKNHPEMAVRINNLGSVLWDMGDLGGARFAFEHALEIDEQNFGKNHPNVAIGLNNLGNVLQALGDLKGARVAFERAININEYTFGKDHPEIARNTNNLGGVLRALGDFNGALVAVERAIKIDKAFFSESHPNIAADVNTRGLILQDMGDLDGAYTAFNHAVRILEANFVNSHPNIGSCYMNLGYVLQAQERITDAKAYYKRALEIFERFLPLGHPNIETAKEWLQSLDDVS